MYIKELIIIKLSRTKFYNVTSKEYRQKSKLSIHCSMFKVFIIDTKTASMT